MARYSVLEVGDTFQGRVLKIHQTFFIFNITRGHQKIERLIEGKISGIETILRVEKN